jgi:hypothetical protein
MNKIIKSIPLILFLFTLHLNVFSQEEQLKNIITAGVSTPVLDNGWGIHAGYNPVFSWTNNYLSLEGYAGYHYTAITGGFLSGNKAQLHRSELFIGPRLYFNKKDKSIRPFINVLMGLQLTLEKDENQEYNTLASFGLSPGFFVSIKRFTAGVFLASPDNIGIRFGYEW